MRVIWAGVLATGLLASPGASSAAPPELASPGARIVIDVGHGGVDSGTTYGTILEKDINLAVGLKLYSLLQSRHVAASINRTTDYALSDDNPGKNGGRHRRDLAQRVEIANKLKPAFMLSLHVNWTANAARSGPLVIYRKNQEQGKRLAMKLQQELNRLYGTNTEPVASKSYYVLTHGRIPSVIVEMGFLSNKKDRQLLVTPQFQQKLADAIAKACTDALKEDFASYAGNKSKTIPQK
ncbi:N-acetylmuramoyl-L-alanine amidase [Paenibacillus sp. YN15]|uniref:N-acetylmuramoyl-L-alanine amidase family protein n=1 Tax=Paenibacillus sp. YN15 TaxID=1742774 RepID=UPI000DCC3E90|nr:N-acetylmuramoyl-L-alanine amidase [Paenibacillus sp. YN15]RAV06343.1 N-acetylmuramoyl-L-alanine amidase [Paenibacillus sp. YN15]